jgi:hypothetical protein
MDVDPEAEAPLRFLGSTGAVNGGAAAARRLHERRRRGGTAAP